MPTTKQYDEIKAMDLSAIKRKALFILTNSHRGRNRRAEKWAFVEEVMGHPIPLPLRTANNSDERKVREAINELRKEKNLILSNSGGSGWWVPDDVGEVLETVRELRSRATDMLETARLIEEASQERFSNQMGLL